MKWTIEFEVLGDPIALKRHRSFQKGEFRGTYDPSKSDKADFFDKAFNHQPATPYNEPLYVSMTFFFHRPKSHFGTGSNSNKLKPGAPIWVTKTPDIDNLVKFICDSLNSIFWSDDRIICEMHVRKLYSAVPRVRIRIIAQSEIES